MSSLIRSARVESESRMLELTALQPGKVLPDGDSADLPEDIRFLTDVPLDEMNADQSDHAKDAAGSIDASGDCCDADTETASGNVLMTYEEYRAELADELKKLQEDAFEQGYEEGRKSGQDAAETEYREQIDQVASLVDGLREAFRNEIDGLTDLGAEIVFEAVVRILGRNYLERDGAVAVVREVIRHAKDRTRLVVRVSPHDFARLNEERETLIEGWNSQQIDIIADDRVELGGCLLETPSGNLDGRMEVQLQQLRETFLNARLRHTESVLDP